MHASLADFISEVAQNAVEAGAKNISLDVFSGPRRLTVCCNDDGKGMSPADVLASWDPRRSERGKHSRRRMGLGLPLLRQAVEAAGGDCSLSSAPGKGTRIEFTFDLGHMDCPPIGDLPGTWLTVLAFPGDHELTVERHDANGRSARVGRKELIEVLGNLEQGENLIAAKQYLRNFEDHVRTGEMEP